MRAGLENSLKSSVSNRSKDYILKTDQTSTSSDNEHHLMNDTTEFDKLNDNNQ